MALKGGVQMECIVKRVYLENLEGKEVSDSYHRFAQECIDGIVEIVLDGETGEIQSIEVIQAHVFVIDQDGGEIDDYGYEDDEEFLIDAALKGMNL